MDVDVTLLEDGKTLSISQHIEYVNSTGKVLEHIYLYDWVNAFSDKKSALAQSFSEEFVRKFHFASKEERGGTTIKTLMHKSDSLFWKRPLNYPDVVHVKLPEPLPSGQSYSIDITYEVVIPDARFTNFGVNEKGVVLKYWLLKPAFYKDKWYIYSHRKVFDMPQQVIDLSLKFSHPKQFKLYTSLSTTNSKETSTGNYKQVEFERQLVVDTDIHLLRQPNFDITNTEYGRLVTNIESDELQPQVKSLIGYRVLEYLNDKLGPYPFENLVVSEQDYQIAPVYGLNQLPSFIAPYPDGFLYDIKVIKAVTAKYLKNTMLINTRDDAWVLSAIQMSLVMDYVKTFYPDIKLLGKLSTFVFLEWFHIADLEFNDQYDFLLKNVTRNNIHQSLDTPQDSLIKFNQKIANSYFAGLGFRYLKDYTSASEIDNGVKSFYNSHKLKFSTVDDFRIQLSNSTNKNIDWFFDEFVSLVQPIDFKIKSVKKSKDSITVKLLNKRKTQIPVSLFWIKDKQAKDKIWIDPFDSIAEITIPRKDAERLGLNHDGIIPEVNRRNNYKGISKFLNKPVQFRLLEDAENPSYNQLFIMPQFTYNLYDGVSVGPSLYNKAILPRQLQYKISPKYALGSNEVVGSASVSYTSWQYDKDLFGIRMGLSGSRFSYDFDLFYERFMGFLSLSYRDNDNRRSNLRQQLSLRTVNVRRDRNQFVQVNEPDYNVFNIKYLVQDKNLDKFFTASVDYELAQQFSKLYGTVSFRRLNENNRQINLRLFAGAFLYNDIPDSDFFSFALDRPADYMFDYNYYGRSEESGLFSQQFIMADGGFKSQLEPDFANQWLVTFNTSLTIWNWIFAYADAGFVGNKFQSGQFVYDSGIKLNFVEDYFELFLPIYSSKGWEFDTPNYDQSIRFIVSLDINTLLKLFTRRWY
jgi:hypothetical protein